MKRNPLFFGLCILVCLTLALSACSSRDAGSATSTGTPAPVPAEAAPTPAPTEAPQEPTPTEEPDWLALYGSVIENYRAIAGADRDDFDSGLDPYSLMESYDLTIFNEVTYGYRLQDLDGNGVPELIVGNMVKTDSDWDNLIFALFTLTDGQPQKVFGSWARNRYYLSDAGGIYHTGSGGAMWTDAYLCEYHGTEVTPVSGCFTSDEEGGGYFRVVNGDRYTGQVEAVTPEEFGACFDALEASILPLGELTPMPIAVE